MIVSPSNSLIFLHARKAAGSSLAVSLARHLGPEDLQVSGLVETARHGIPYTARVRREAAAQTNGLSRIAPLFGAKINGRVHARAIDHHYRPRLGRKPPHAPATRVRDTFAEVWDKAARLVIVRNPWDKTVSDYYWRIKGLSDPPSFPAYVAALDEGRDLGGVVPLAFHDNWPLYTIADTVVATHVVRFERLAEDLAPTLDEIGLDWDGWLPRAKGGTRKAKAHWRDHYDDRTRAVVARLYAPEIAHWGYRFEETA